MLALVAIAAYFPREPVDFFLAGRRHFARRSDSSASGTSNYSFRAGMSNRIRSPSRTRAIVPPAAASGET